MQPDHGSVWRYQSTEEAHELLRTPLRNCPKSPTSARGAAPWTAVNPVFGPLNPPHVVRIRLQSLPRTPFRTVSKRSSQIPIPRTPVNEGTVENPPGFNASLTQASLGTCRVDLLRRRS